MLRGERGLRKEVRAFKALADETRLRLLGLLLEGELCVCDLTLALGITQSRASRNLAILEGAGVLRSRRAGKWVYYSLADSAEVASDPLFQYLHSHLRQDPLICQDRDNLSRLRHPGAGRPPC